MDPNNLQIGDTISIQGKTYEVLDIIEEKDPETKENCLLIRLDKNATIKYLLTSEQCYINNTAIKAEDIIYSE